MTDTFIFGIKPEDYYLLLRLTTHTQITVSKTLGITYVRFTLGKKSHLLPEIMNNIIMSHTNGVVKFELYLAIVKLLQGVNS